MPAAPAEPDVVDLVHQAVTDNQVVQVVQVVPEHQEHQVALAVQVGQAAQAAPDNQVAQVVQAVQVHQEAFLYKHVVLQVSKFYSIIQQQ